MAMIGIKPKTKGRGLPRVYCTLLMPENSGQPVEAGRMFVQDMGLSEGEGEGGRDGMFLLGNRRRRRKLTNTRRKKKNEKVVPGT